MASSTRVTGAHSFLLQLSQARERSDALFEIVRPEALYERPIPERHRIIFYLGHLEAFDWNLFGRELGELKSSTPGLDKLFAFGIDPVSGNLPDDQPGDWPERKEVFQYNRGVRAALDEQLAAGLEGPDERRRTLSQFLNVAIEHRLMHVETLAYMLHRLPINLKRARKNAAPPRAPQVRPQMAEIPAGVATLGLKRDDGVFGWDNEFEENSVFVPAFRIDTYKVTNLQYLRFIAEGGYREKSFWSDLDWEWLQSSGTLHPAFWIRRGNQFFFRTMFDEVPLPGDWPVYVSHAEASAYARWARKELPSEANGTGRPIAPTMAPNVPIHGATTCRTRASAILILTIGIRLRPLPFRQAAAPLASPISLVMAGNGRAASLPHSMDSSRFRSTRATRLISSMNGTTS